MDETHDKDSSMDAWELLYKIVYKDLIEQYFDVNTLSDKETNKERYYLKLNNSLQKQTRFKKFKMAGDCDFNFNSGKVIQYKELLSNDKKVIAEADDKTLSWCANHHHELVNFSWMPITGELNCKKGLSKHYQEEKSMDRFDLFINKLDSYYENKNREIFSKRNQEALEWYLNQFSNIYDYCKKIYFIDDKKFVDEIIESGKRPINSRESALNYMDLAKRYWELKQINVRNIWNLILKV